MAKRVKIGDYSGLKEGNSIWVVVSEGVRASNANTSDFQLERKNRIYVRQFRVRGRSYYCYMRNGFVLPVYGDIEELKQHFGDVVTETASGPALLSVHCVLTTWNVLEFFYQAFHSYRAAVRFAVTVTERSQGYTINMLEKPAIELADLQRMRVRPLNARETNAAGIRTMIEQMRALVKKTDVERASEASVARDGHVSLDSMSELVSLHLPSSDKSKMAIHRGKQRLMDPNGPKFVIGWDMAGFDMRADLEKPNVPKV